VSPPASSLDPKCAKAFNCPVVNQYFDELTELVKSLGIPIENLYNMDGIELKPGFVSPSTSFSFDSHPDIVCMYYNPLGMLHVFCLQL
jgi:hypothetical protein